MKKEITFIICTVIIASLSACVNSNLSNGNSIPPFSTKQQNIAADETKANTSNLLEINEDEIVSPEPETFTAFGGNVTFKLYESSEFYKLYIQENGVGSYYEIWNEQDKLIDFGFQKKDCKITQNGSFLEYSMSWGTYCRLVKYIDVYNNRVSRFFDSPLATKDELVVYTAYVDDEHCIVIQNIFDPTVFYKTIVLEPVPNSTAQFDAVFIDNQYIQIQYSSNDGVITQVYDLLG